MTYAHTSQSFSFVREKGPLFPLQNIHKRLSYHKSLKMADICESCKITL